MKRLFGCFLILLFAAGFMAADEYVIGTVSYYDYEYGNVKSFNIKYEDDDKQFYIQTADWYTTAWIELSSAQLTALRDSLTKAMDWAKIAEENGSEVKKEIPNSTISSNVTWKSGDSWYKNDSWNKLGIHMHFVAAGEKGDTVSTLLLIASKVQASSNKYEKYEFPTMVLLKPNIEGFLEVISEDNIKKVIDKHNESKKAEDLFN